MRTYEVSSAIVARFIAAAAGEATAKVEATVAMAGGDREAADRSICVYLVAVSVFRNTIRLMTGRR